MSADRKPSSRSLGNPWDMGGDAPLDPDLAQSTGSENEQADGDLPEALRDRIAELDAIAWNLPGRASRGDRPGRRR